MESSVVEEIVSNLEMDGKTRVSVASMENGVLYCCAQQTGMHIRCGSTAYYLAILPGKRPDTYRHKKTLGRAPVSSDIAGPCPAEPFQLVPTQLRACESPPKRGLLATFMTGSKWRRQPRRDKRDQLGRSQGKVASGSRAASGRKVGRMYI
jgi:hypothetical protein